MLTEVNYDYQKLLNTATDVGHFLLESGAEIYRIEESIQRILYAYGVKHVDVFAIPSYITVTITTHEDKCYTRLRRITTRGTNYTAVNQLNNLCREICQEKPSMEEIHQKLKEIRQGTRYSYWALVGAFAAIAAAFALFFGGDLADALVAAGCGAIVRIVVQYMEKFHTNPFFINLINSAMVTILAVLFVDFQVAHHVDKIIIGTLMNLVPGVAITNSIRDIIAGDLMAGLVKGVEALMVALALALGTGVALIAAGGIV